MNGKTARAYALLVTLALVVPSAANAGQARAGGPAKHSKKAPAHQNATPRPTGEDDHSVFDREGHRRVIHEYEREGLPPGLATRQSLPAGLEKRLREGGELPPGVQKRWVGVPGDLVARMPPMAPYYHRYFAGDDLVVVDTRTTTIAYLLRDVLR